MRTKALWGAALVLTGGGGFLAGRMSAAPSGQEEVLRELRQQRELLTALLSRSEAGSSPTRGAPAGGAVDVQGLRAEVARAVREELKAAGAERLEPREEPAPAPPAPKAVAAHQEGLRLIDEATRSRRWRDEDAHALGRLLVDMTPAQRQEVIRRLTTTLNAGGIDVQAVSPF